MPSAKFDEVYKKVSAMGEKLKASGAQGPSNDEQLKVRFPLSHFPSMLPSALLYTAILNFPRPGPKLQ